MTPVPMGVDAKLFERARIEPVQDARLDGRRVVLYLGRVARSRKSDFLLDVAGHLRAAMPEALLVIAGDAPSNDEMDWMRREIAARGLADHVLLTGWLPQRTALGYAVRAEIGLSPIPRGTLFDVSSPTKLVEYLALGIPSVQGCACPWKQASSPKRRCACCATRSWPPAWPRAGRAGCAATAPTTSLARPWRRPTNGCARRQQQREARRCGAIRSRCP
jgi:hypothetical protein